jgi:EAL domain-containing protein (putative c-di-GMP-specific phosphodiesterase class I)
METGSREGNVDGMGLTGMDLMNDGQLGGGGSIPADLDWARMDLTDRALEPVRERVQTLLKESRLRIAFQPIVELSTRSVIGYEALARFPQEFSISPAEWFADAAKVGLQLEMDLAAIQAALSHFHELPPDSFISLNASPVTVSSPELYELLATVPGERVVLEISESAAVDGHLEVSEPLDLLRERGVRIALDDTGSGADVSLQSLLDVRADIIKIDTVVTRGIQADPMKEAVAVALRSLAERSGAISLAEGIETEAELVLLRALEVEAGQGYLFGRPRAAGS